MKRRVTAIGITLIIMVMASACAGKSTAETAPAEPAPAAEAQETPDESPAPETPDESPAPEAVDESDAPETADESAPDIDISGCDTFTQIIDKKLSDGMGYANVKIGDTDAFLVSSGTYDNLDGNMAAIDAAVIIYNDGVPEQIGAVCAGGTAYPLSVKDDILYVGGNHRGIKYTIKDNELVALEDSYVEYDAQGNEKYSYTSADGKDEDAESKFNAFFEEMDSAAVIDFQPVGGAAGQ